MTKTDKELKEIYPNWLHIEPPISKIYLDINREIGRKRIQENHSRIFQKYVDKYYRTWDNLSCCMNVDMGYSPVVLCLFAEDNNIPPMQPIKIIRRILNLKSND